MFLYSVILTYLDGTDVIYIENLSYHTSISVHYAATPGRNFSVACILTVYFYYICIHLCVWLLALSFTRVTLFVTAAYSSVSDLA